MTFAYGVIAGVLGTIVVAWVSISVWATAWFIWDANGPKQHRTYPDEKGEHVR